MKQEAKDPAEFFQERDFPGRKFLAIGAAVWGIWWLASWGANFERIPAAIESVILVVVLLASVLYLFGFWKAVKGKGYHPVLFLISFTGFIGLIVIFFLPNKNENQSELDNPIDAAG